MKYTQQKNLGRSIIHQFSKEGSHYIGGKKWSKVDMSFNEVPTNSTNRSFMFVIRYSNPEDREFKLTQFSMKEDEIKEFISTVCETVNNPPKFKERFEIGDKFIIPNINVEIGNSSYRKETNYTNVRAELTSISNIDGQRLYILTFDNNSIVTTEDSLSELKRSL
jgi:hypothetical protein